MGDNDPNVRFTHLLGPDVQGVHTEISDQVDPEMNLAQDLLW